MRQSSWRMHGSMRGSTRPSSRSDLETLIHIDEFAECKLALAIGFVSVDG